MIFHPPKMYVLTKKTFLQIILSAKWLVRYSIKYVPQPAATTFGFSSCLILILWGTLCISHLEFFPDGLDVLVNILPNQLYKT